jgi:hypothetical protein
LANFWYSDSLGFLNKPSIMESEQEPQVVAAELQAAESEQQPEEVGAIFPPQTPNKFGVGKWVKARAHILLGGERANSLYSQLATSTWAYGKVIRCCGRQRWLVRVDLDGSEVEMARTHLIIVSTEEQMLAADLEGDSDNESDTEIDAHATILQQNRAVAVNTGNEEDVVVDNITWKFGGDVTTDTLLTNCVPHLTDTFVDNFDFEAADKLGGFFWHLFPLPIATCVDNGNKYADGIFASWKEMTEQEFKNFWGLILLGCLCEAKGNDIWEIDPEGFITTPDFNDYMAESRFKKIRTVSESY